MTKTTFNAADWLRDAARRLSGISERPNAEAQLILVQVLGRPRDWLLAHPEKTLEEDSLQRAEVMLRRYLDGEPLPYVLGRWEFFNLELVVSPAVLIPRPETELLVEKALAWLKAHPKGRTAADVGTGSGCIAGALAYHITDLLVTALDLSTEALAVAQVNFKRLGVAERVTVRQGHLVEGLTAAVDVVCANLPYIPSQQLSGLAVAGREPRLALDGGSDGLRLIEALMMQLAERNLCRGLALFEIEANQGKAAQALAERFFPRVKIAVEADLAGLDRLLVVEVGDGE